jgi:hypothetical protein
VTKSIAKQLRTFSAVGFGVQSVIMMKDIYDDLENTIDRCAARRRSGRTDSYQEHLIRILKLATHA